MLEQPIRRKYTKYPKDFIQNKPKEGGHSVRYDFNENNHSDVNSIKPLEELEDVRKMDENVQIKLENVPNPEKYVIGQKELQQESPLLHHECPKKHNLDQNLLKKPRFSINNQTQIPQENNQILLESSSPGSIRRQLETKQNPLPLEDTVKIQHYRHNNRHKIPDSVILFKSTTEINSKKWISSEKDLIQKFKQSRIKRNSQNQLPIVSKTNLNQIQGSARAHSLYNSFRLRQQKNQRGQVSNLLVSLKNQQETQTELPKFKPNMTVQKLKEEINWLARTKQKIKEPKTHNQIQPYSSDSEGSNGQNKTEYTFKKKVHGKGPQFVVSYRTSLSYLKDLKTKVKHLPSYKLTIKIPKLFTQQIIYRSQQKSELYETAHHIFTELNLPNQNLIIKRYTNCVMIISRNIALIWSYEGKRYLGGWQSQYLDEGFKHGVGLEWQAKKYVYYGQFVRNKREGLGVYKDRKEDRVVGYWRRGKLIQEEEEEEEEQENDSNNEVNYY